MYTSSARNQQGFSALHVLLVIIILGIVGGTGYYVWQSTSNANDLLSTSDSTNTNANTKEAAKDCDIDGSMKAKMVSSPKQEISFCAPYGWNMFGMDAGDGTGGVILANSEGIKYNAAGSEPVLKFIEGGGDSLYPFSVMYGPAKDSNTLDTTGYAFVETIKTNKGGEVRKYSHLTGKDDVVGSGIDYRDEGTMQYLYTFEKPTAAVTMFYAAGPSVEDVHLTFDNIAKTFE